MHGVPSLVISWASAQEAPSSLGNVSRGHNLARALAVPPRKGPTPWKDALLDTTSQPLPSPSTDACVARTCPARSAEARVAWGHLRCEVGQRATVPAWAPVPQQHRALQVWFWVPSGLDTALGGQVCRQLSRLSCVPGGDILERAGAGSSHLGPRWPVCCTHGVVVGGLLGHQHSLLRGKGSTGRHAWVEDTHRVVRGISGQRVGQGWLPADRDSRLLAFL